MTKEANNSSVELEQVEKSRGIKDKQNYLGVKMKRCIGSLNLASGTLMSGVYLTEDTAQVGVTSFKRAVSNAIEELEEVYRGTQELCIELGAVTELQMLEELVDEIANKKKSRAAEEKERG